MQEENVNTQNEDLLSTNRRNRSVTSTSKPSSAYVIASWLVLLIGVVCYLIGLYNAEMELNEKGYYLTILLLGLFSVVALQKSIRDKTDGVPVSNIFTLFRGSPHSLRLYY